MAKFQCPMCQYVTGVSLRYQNHVASVHDKIRDFECEQCSYKTDRNDRLISHIRTVHENQSPPKDKLECELCNFVTFQNSKLASHIKTAHLRLQLQQYKCEDCDFRANQKNYLLRHKKAVHDNIKDHKCKECPYASSLPYSLKKHMKRVHEKESPVEKQEDKGEDDAGTFLDKIGSTLMCAFCDFDTPRVHLLAFHVEECHKNTPKNQFECQLCGYAFFQNSQLSRHIKTVHMQLQQYKCDGCEYRASRKSLILRHKKAKHDGIKDHKCEACTFACSSSYNLKMHMMRIHGNVTPVGKVGQRQEAETTLDRVPNDVEGKKCQICKFVAKTEEELTSHLITSHVSSA